MHPIDFSPEQIAEIARMISDPAFWVILLIGAVFHAVLKATVSHFRK
jgi:hypothetical protein